MTLIGQTTSTKLLAKVPRLQKQSTLIKWPPRLSSILTSAALHTLDCRTVQRVNYAETFQGWQRAHMPPCCFDAFGTVSFVTPIDSFPPFFFIQSLRQISATASQCWSIHTSLMSSHALWHNAESLMAPLHDQCRDLSWRRKFEERSVSRLFHLEDRSKVSETEGLLSASLELPVHLRSFILRVAGSQYTQ